MLRFRPTLSVAAVMLTAALVVAASSAGRAQTPEPTLPSDPGRLAEMQHHFMQVTLIHEALIRGDLQALRAPARELSALAMPWRVPASASAKVSVIRDAGRRMITATSVASAAESAGTALSVCGDCHQSLGVKPVPSPTGRPNVGGIVGHMVEHQRAMDELVQGIVIPSPVVWNQGVARLRTAPLSARALPSGSGLSNQVRSSETRVHALADEAARSNTLERRAAVYGQLLATCSQCHGLHSRIWGPTSGR